MSISIDNFSMDLGDVAYCTSLVDFNVRITDDVHSVTTSGTYFTENGVIVPSTLTAINRGYLLSYTTTPSGNMSLIAHGSNDNGEYQERLYQLSYGYEASWEKVTYWDANKEVPVAISATNTSLATNTSYFSTFFETRKMLTTDLEVSISAEGSGITDIMTYITPRSKHFRYGKTYSITVSGIKDFNGNVLAPFIYSFTIEVIN